MVRVHLGGLYLNYEEYDMNEIMVNLTLRLEFHNVAFEVGPNEFKNMDEVFDYFKDAAAVPLKTVAAATATAYITLRQLKVLTDKYKPLTIREVRNWGIEVSITLDYDLGKLGIDQVNLLNLGGEPPHIHELEELAILFPNVLETENKNKVLV